mmetsp:Transcript_18977/g.26701  ORF Transcript_18977/g.26701 Transcript_18977/m.26701 type:complete len:226 (+) Transcript_18977:3-680(+)
MAKPSPMGILLGGDVDDHLSAFLTSSSSLSSSPHFPLEDLVASMEQSRVSVWPGTRKKIEVASSFTSSSSPPAAAISALSRLYTCDMDSSSSSSSSLEIGIKRFDFSTPSPDDIARDKRRTRLDTAKTKVKSTRTKRGGHQPMAPPRRERSVEREVREELERDRAEELARLGVHSDHDLGMSAGGGRTRKKNSGLSGRGEPRDEKAKQAGIKARKKNRNSKMNRR